MFLADGHFFVDRRYLKEPTISYLLIRYKEIMSEIFDHVHSKERDPELDYEHMFSILAEAHQIYTELERRNLVGRYGKTHKGKTIYLAHSSRLFA